MARAISADGARAGAVLIERSYREGDDTQFLRELVQNGLEAQATKMQLGIHWPSAAADWSVKEVPDHYPYTIRPKRYRMVYYDNGCGMGDEMVDYMAGLLDLSSKNQAAGDLHGNFAMGVRVSTLPWNKAGVIVASWTAEFPEGKLMWLRYVPDRSEALGYYEAATLSWLEDGKQLRSEVAPAELFDEFISDRPDWLGYTDEQSGEVGTGTMLLFLGNTGQEHTFLGPEGNWMTHTGPNYLTHRYYAHPAGVELRYEDPRTSDVEAWASRRRDRLGRTTLDGSIANSDSRVLNEPVRPTGILMSGAISQKGNSEAATITLPDGGRMFVNLIPADAVQKGGGRRLAERPGISVLYRNELYHRRDGARDYQKFGISSASVYRRLSIIIEPRQADDVNDPRGGVFPTSSRTSLNYVQPRTFATQGRDLPWGLFEQSFIDNMPDFVVKAIEASIPDDHTDVDQDVIDKVAQPFMEMFKRVIWSPKENGATPGTPKGEGSIGAHGMRRKRNADDAVSGQPAPGGGRGLAASGNKGGDDPGDSRKVPAAIPECHFSPDAFSDEEVEQRPRIGVKYIPGRTGQLGTVVIDPRFPLIEDVTNYWVEHTAPPQHEDARKAVRVVYSTAMACRVGQMLALADQQGLTHEELTRAFMSNEALTGSLFGLASEHAVIKTRLSGRLRRGPSTSAGSAT
ncbi:hypothetical protein [Rhodococcoides corynebacterioides]|uniref:ATP-binding protein n=1 Tax=Rhodococcoides corynebacterioides TaxID=53972 RepID=A0ABS7P2B6_9NOCA|nr:hypothetical protein [Rhodococcus corynebacterioides]MBY6366533.1 hypothetical protein [Rhodococcus corynebacterioides]MBY6408098.1 hypothetical protein [Rhodococcus corynebacterioides]